MFITVKETTKLFETPSMLRKHLFLPGYHFFKLLSGLLDFCGDFHKQSKISNGYVKFCNLLEDIFLIYYFYKIFLPPNWILIHTLSLCSFAPKASYE